MGWLPGVMASPLAASSNPDFEDAILFGVGASDLACSALATGSEVPDDLIDLISVAEGVSGARGVSAGSVVQQKSMNAVMIKTHLSGCRPGEGAVPGCAATTLTLAVLEDRRHWPIGHIWRSTPFPFRPPPQFWSFRTRTAPAWLTARRAQELL